jgi:penicillin-binding protein 2
MRTSFVRWFMAVLAGLLLAGLGNLQFVQGSMYRNLSERNCVRMLPQIGARGRILDASGRPLVDSFLTYDVLVLPQKKERLREVLEDIARVMVVDADALERMYKRNFVTSSVPVVVARNVDTHKAIALEEMKSQIDGVMIQPHPIREYPFGARAGHLIGYLNEIDHWRLTKLAEYGYKTKDIVGYTGIEERYDYYLRQEEGGLSMEVDHRGRFMRLLGFKAPVDGSEVQLTLDLDIQRVVEEALDDRHGSVIVMDPFTGEIKAMASGPGYEPGAFVHRKGEQLSKYFNDPGVPLLNRSIAGVYPAASVFKVVVAAAALEAGKIQPSTTYVCQGGIQFGNRRFGCWDVHHEENLYDALAHSCDVYFYRTGLLVGPQSIHDWAVRFGLGKPTGIDLPYESMGSVPSPSWKRRAGRGTWYDGDTLNFSIGQGDLMVTPLQMARLMAVFANDGALVTPYVVSQVAGKDVSALKRRSVKVGLRKDTLQEIRVGLTRVVEDGTGEVLKGAGVSVAGKTGTAQVPKGLSHAWFAGYFPQDDPRYVICVFLEHGASGQAACVLARKVIEGMVQEKLL